MTVQEIFKLMNENPAFYLATADGDQPRVRGMLLFRADENGIVFHTASSKEVFSQMKANPKAEMCFSAGNVQIRVTGTLEQVFDEKLREEIFAHPTRQFLHLPAWTASGQNKLLQIFVMKNCSAITWTMETNFDEKQPVKLC